MHDRKQNPQMSTAQKRQIQVSADKVAICRRDDAKTAPMLLLEQCELLEAPVQVVALVVPGVAVPMDLSINPERKTEQRGQSEPRSPSEKEEGLGGKRTCSSAQGSVRCTVPSSGFTLAKA